MAGDWIKWDKGLPWKRKVVQMADELRLERRFVAALCMEVWEWLDENSRDGCTVHGARKSAVDDRAGVPGFADAMEKVDWLRETHDGLLFPNAAEHNRRKTKRQSPKKVDAAKELPGFEAFWSEWPKHSRKVGKVQNQHRWERDNLEAEADAILAGLRKWKSSKDWLKENGQYIPMPSTWLNQRRWEVVGCDAKPVAANDPVAEYIGGLSREHISSAAAEYERLYKMSPHVLERFRKAPLSLREFRQFLYERK